MQGKKVHFIPRRIELIIPKKCQCALIPSLLRAGRSTLNVFSPQRKKRIENWTKSRYKIINFWMNTLVCNWLLVQLLVLIQGLLKQGNCSIGTRYMMLRHRYLRGEEWNPRSGLNFLGLSCFCLRSAYKRKNWEDHTFTASYWNRSIVTSVILELHFILCNCNLKLR